VLSGCQQKPVDNKLDLSGKQLEKVPDYVFKLTNLEELNISNNQITGNLPVEIRNLKNLRVLSADDNLMTGIPAEIGQLPSLQVFSINNNLLAGIPKEMGQAKNLRTLDLSNNQLTGLPNELASLENLETLNLSGNQYLEQDFDSIKNSLPNVNYILE